MPATEFLCQIIGVASCKFSKEENALLEANLLARLCDEIEKNFQDKYKNYLCLIKFDKEREKNVLEDNLIRCLINDILSTEEYTLSGLAYYMHMPEEIIYEAATGLNTTPSATLLRKIVELHRSVRPELYREIMKKITHEYMIVEQKTAFGKK